MLKPLLAGFEAAACCRLMVTEDSLLAGGRAVMCTRDTDEPDVVEGDDEVVTAVAEPVEAAALMAVRVEAEVGDDCETEAVADVVVLGPQDE